MKSLSHVSRPKKIALTIVLFVILGGLILFISEKTRTTDLIHLPTKKTPAQAEGATKEQQAAQAKADAEIKQQYLDSTVTEQPADTQPADADAGLTISASQPGTTVTILTKIQSVTSGTCTLSISNGAKTTEQTAPVIYQPEFSSCAGFSVSTGTLGAGSWNITVTVTSGSGEPATQSTSLEVQ